MIDHDRLFKELLSTFFLEFLELFLPEIASTIDPDSPQFLPQEYFADLTTGEDKIIDLLVQVQQAGQPVGFLVHIEAQSTPEADFARRMFFYFARLYQKYLQRVYPIVVFSFDEPHRPEPHQHTIAFPDWTVLEFNFRTIQLNRLNWRDYLTQRNPVAAALMAKMRIAPVDRPKVKVECLRLLTTLRLDPARTRLISGFVDTYLQLNVQETQVFQSEISRLEPREQETAMEIVTSWKREGIAEGIEQGIEQGEQAKQMEILKRMLAEQLPIDLIARITGLSIEQIQQAEVSGRDE
jgi:predicted transposase YdaD